MRQIDVDQMLALSCFSVSCLLLISIYLPCTRKLLSQKKLAQLATQLLQTNYLYIYVCRCSNVVKIRIELTNIIQAFIFSTQQLFKLVSLPFNAKTQSFKIQQIPYRIYNTYIGGIFGSIEFKRVQPDFKILNGMFYQTLRTFFVIKI